MNPFAFFDCLAISAKLERSLGDVAIPELHLFSYLGCLLSLYRSMPVTAWEYSFTGTKEGSPFSVDIDDAKSELVLGGYCTEEDEFVQLTADGRGEYGILKTLDINRRRDEFLDAACSSALALPIGYIRNAVSHDSEMIAATKFSRARHLLAEPARESLYESFGCLTELIGEEARDLLFPAVVWIRYLGSSSPDDRS